MKRRLQDYMFYVFLIFFVAGLFYPPLGILAIVCMLAPVVMAPFKGRFWCGNYCPRGSFYDHLLSRLSPQKQIPEFFRRPAWRNFMVLFIMTMFSVQMYYAWGDPAAVGMVFILIIGVTTLAGIFLGVIYHQRAWCAFCPMGTIAGWISHRKKPLPLMVKDNCIGCKACNKVCPMQLSPYKAQGLDGGFTGSDCLKCGRCVEKCPRHSLDFLNG